MKHNFAVLILSHGRAEKVITYHELKKAGYTGRIIIVVDDMDDQCALYKAKYKDVYVFDKKSVLTDAMTNREEWGSVVYARNVCYQIAEEEKLDYFAMFDDDLSGFTLRYEEDESLKSKKIDKMDEIFSAMIAFMEDSGTIGLNIAASGALFAGIRGVFSDGLGRNLNQSFILSTRQRMVFRGLLNNDVITLMENSERGALLFETYHVTKNTPKRSTNDGGLKSLYQNHDDYLRNIYAVMAKPNCCKFKIKKDKVVLEIHKDSVYPKILNERYKVV